MQLRNIMEDAVMQYVDHWLPSSDICRCEACRLDIMALMLNNLPAYYVVTDAGALFARLHEFDLQYKADIMVAMTDAVEKVRNNPRHEVK